MHLHVAAVMVFEPRRPTSDEPAHPLRSTGCAPVVEERIHLVPPLRRRVVRVPFGLHHPVWVEDPDFDLDYHLRRASLPAPGGPASWPPSSPTWPAALSTSTARCGRCTSSRASSPATSPSSPSSTTPLFDGASGAEVLAPSSTSGRSPRRRPHRRGPWRPEPIPTETRPDRLGAVVAGPPARAAPPAPCAARSAPCGSWPSATAACARRTTSSRRRRRSAHRARRSTAPSRPTGASPSSRCRWTTSRPCAGPSAGPSTTSSWPLWPARCGGCWPSAASGSTIRSWPWCPCRPAPTPIAGVLGNKVHAMLVSLATTSPTPSSAYSAIAAGTRLAKDQARVLSEDLLREWAQLAVPGAVVAAGPAGGQPAALRPRARRSSTSSCRTSPGPSSPCGVPERGWWRSTRSGPWSTGWASTSP